MLLNGNHPIIFVLNQPHITSAFYSKYFMKAETLNDKLLVQSSSSVSLFGEDSSHIVPSEGTKPPMLVDSSHVVSSCEIHNNVLELDIPRMAAMYCDGNICNVNSVKSSTENCQALRKQECKEVIPLTPINNTEHESSQQGVAVDGITQERGGDAIVPDIDHSSKSSFAVLKDGTTPAVLLEAGSMAALNTYTLYNQDSSSPPDIKCSDSHFMQYCFATEKESLLNEESDYELELLSPTRESLQLQSCVVDCSQRSTSSISATSDHNVLSPQYVTVTSSQNIHTLDYYSEAAADGSATVDQALPVETAKQPHMGLFCNEDTVAHNTDDDFEENLENTLIIVDPELQSQQTCNNSYNPGKIFPRHIKNNVADHSPHTVDQVVPSIDLCDDDDGPSCLLRAMEMVERKDHHFKRPRTMWERILFTGNYYGK